MTVQALMVVALLASAAVTDGVVPGLESRNCSRSADAAERIAACTDIINTGGLLGEDVTRAYHIRAGAYRETRQYRRAIADFDRALEMQPVNAAILFERAGAYMNVGDYTRAIADYDASLELDPSNANAYFMRGVSHNQLGQSPQAVLDYSEALRLEPAFPPVYNERAWARYLLGDYAAALKDAEQALAMQPRMAPALDTRAHVLAALGRSDEALADFERAIDAGGRRFVVMYQRALIQHGFYDGKTDGVYADAVRAALVACLLEQCRLLK